MAILVAVGMYKTTSGGPSKVEPDLSSFPLALGCEIEPYAAPDVDFGETNLRPPYLAQSASVQAVDSATINISVTFSGVLPSGPRETTSPRLGTFLMGSDFGFTVFLQGNDGPAISVDREPGSSAEWSFTETADTATLTVDSPRSSVTVRPSTLDVAIALDDFTLAGPQIEPSIEVSAFEFRPPTSEPSQTMYPYQVCS
ncbi:hypothetical protein [Rhodococcus sp. IEGM1428]|uniref:hypothetical protein n=1 Tax=Rhodococcus sp. IEGM1428 TaxID=3392191 RepID=UPI003D0D11A7